MTNLFLIVAEQSLRLSGMILFLWVLRALIRRIPGSALYLLWILVFLGLVLPFRVEVPYHTETPATAAEAILSTEEPDNAPEGLPAAVNPPVSQDQAVNSQNQDVPADLLPLAAVVWAAVSVILVCVNGWKLAVFSRKLHGARQIAPGIYETDRIEVPLVMGYLHPRIYLPAF